jgi:YVTN family beta-propeller protein
MFDYFEHFSFNKRATNIVVITLVLAFVSISILSYDHVFGFTTISVGAFPIPVVVNPNTNLIYVGNAGSNTVSVISGSSNTVLKNVTVGFTPAALAMDTNANMVYVANINSGNVSVINATTNTVVATVPVGILPTGIGVDSNLKKVYVANSQSGTVSVIDVLPGSPTKNSVISTIPLNSGTRAVAVIPNNHEVIVTNGFSNVLYVINGTTNTLIKTLNIGVAADPVAVNPTNNLVYTADLGTGTVTVVNGTTNTVIASIPVGNNPDGIGVNSITKKVYVSDFLDNAVVVINSTTNTVVGEFQVFTPARLAVNEVTNKVYVANEIFHSITVLDGSAPNPPLANAGPDQSVTSGTMVTLSGSSTSLGTLSFSWTQTVGPHVTLSSSNIANPTFTAPSVNTATLLTFQLIVNDGISNSVPSSVNIIVNPVRTFTVNLAAVNPTNLTGSINIGNVTNGTTTSLLFNTPPGTLPFAQLEQNVIPSAVDGNNVSLNFSVSANTPSSLPKPPVNQALFFDVTPSGIDFSKSASFPANQSPLVRFQVNSNFTSQNRFSDGCPVVPILLFNESTTQWQQLGDPQKPNTNKIFVPNTNTNTVSVIDGTTNAIIATIPVGGGPAQLGFV